MADDKRLSGALWRVLILLAFSLFINYVDRGNLSIAAPLLKEEFKLSPSQLGILFSAFFWTYASFLVVSGWLVDRFHAGWLLAAGFFLWSAATIATGFVHGFISLLAFRLLLGAGESVAYPAYSKILSRHFPEYHRGLANAVISVGLACGPAFGTFAGGMLMARYGWRPFFIVLGVVSLLWLLPWFRWMPPDEAGASRLIQAGPTMPDILRKRSAWGTIGGLFTLNFLLYFMITWLPYYLVHERHFSMDKMAGTIGVAYLLMAITSVISGWISDRWIAAGATATLARKTVMSVGQVCAGLLLVACVLAGPDLAVVLLLLAATSFGMCASQTWAISQTLAGPQASGKWTGVQNFMGNLAGIVAPAITGFVVDRTGSFFWAFAIVGAVSLLGPLCWIVVTGPLVQVEWEKPIPMPLRVNSADPA